MGSSSVMDDDWIVVGRFRGVFGVRGELRVESFMEVETSLLDFSSWWVSREEGAQRQKRELVRGRSHSKGLVVSLKQIQSPEAAQALNGYIIEVPREDLPFLDDQEGEEQYYWHDLIDCEVIEADGNRLGVVSHLFETGSNDVLALKDLQGKERLLPFTKEVVRQVDLDKKVITVRLLPGM
ncbi:MAG: 16S rRNA processing protein RimM [Magnetococcales bacterium]|nr:16S rRNA processing protein RimM [Magnetococcales bacterium]